MSGTLNKEQLGRRIPGMKTEIEQFAKKINKADGILILLCLQDAFDNLMNNILRGIIDPDDDLLDPKLRTAQFRFVERYFDLIEQCIVLLALEGAPGSRTITEIPGLTPAL